MNKIKISFTIFLFVFIGYLINLPIDYSKNLNTRTFRRLLTSYDVTAATFLPYEIIKRGTLYFSQETYEGMLRVEEASVHSVMKVGNKYYSSYPILSGIMALPIYLIPIILNKIPALHYVKDLLKILVLGRISASFYTALSVAIFYLILKRVEEIKKYKPTNWIFVFLFFYAFGTNLYSITSRSLWQHTSSLLFISLTIYLLLLSLKNTKYVKWLGITSALMYIARPLNIVFVAFVTVYVFFKHRDKFLKFILFSLPFAIMLFSYNYFAFGSPLTTEYIVKNNTSFSTPLLKGVIGNLLSPARSFLFVSPPLVASFYGFYLYLKKWFKKDSKNKEINTIFALLAITFIVILVIYSKWWCWYGADRFGYGFFTEWLPIVGLFSYLVLKPSGKILKIAFVILTVWSLYAQFNAVWYRKSRCRGDHNWSFYCFKPGFLSKQEY